MKRISHLLLALSAALSGFLASCSMMHEDLAACPQDNIVRFKYDYNMKHADAFGYEVPSVSLHVFDTEGRLVRIYSATVTSDNADDFHFSLNDLPEGTYNLLAWCGADGNKQFTVNHLNVSDPTFDDHSCIISREQEGGLSHIRKDIGRLYHGRLDNVSIVKDEKIHEFTVPLIKDTNVVRVVLQHIDGTPIDKDDFDFTLSEANGLMGADNNLLPDDELTYHPWSQRGGSAQIVPAEGDTRADDAQSTVSAVVAEMTTGRLIAGRNAILTVKNNKTGATVLRVPATDYALLVKGYYYGEDGHTPMSDQEYLDRQDEYPMTFFLTDKDEWINTFIYINSWRVVINQGSAH